MATITLTQGGRLISICAIICGARDWCDVEGFRKHKLHWLKTFLDVGDGLPYDDTYQQFFSFINPDSLEKYFISWISSYSRLIRRPFHSRGCKALTFCIYYSKATKIYASALV